MLILNRRKCNLFVCLFVCLFVWITYKIMSGLHETLPNVCLGSSKNPLHYGDDPDYDPKPHPERAARVSCLILTLPFSYYLP